MPRKLATNTRLGRDDMLEFARTHSKHVLLTYRRDGSAQLSPVTAGVDESGRIVVASYPERAKTANARRTPRASVLVLSELWDDPWMQVDGDVEVLDMPDAEDALVEYFRCVAGREHPDWDEYRAAMREQNKSLIRITPTRWGPLATGGFPSRLAD